MTLWARSPRLAVVETDDTVALIDLEKLDENTVPLILSGPAKLIWTAIDGVRTEEDVVSWLVKEFPDANPEVIRADVRAFVVVLADQGILVASS